MLNNSIKEEFNIRINKILNIICFIVIIIILFIVTRNLNKVNDNIYNSEILDKIEKSEYDECSLNNNYIKASQNKVIKQKDGFEKYFILGYFQYYKQDFKKAKNNFQKAMNYIEEEKNILTISYNGKFLVQCLALEKNYEEANEVYKKICKYIPKDDYIFMYRPIMDMAKYLAIASDKSEIGINELDNIVEKLGSIPDGIRLHLYKNYYQVYKINRNYPMVINYILKSIKLAEKLGEENVMARLMVDLGSIYYNLRDYKHAEETMLKALSIIENNGSKGLYLKNYILDNLVKLYMDLEQYDEALEKAQNIKYVQCEEEIPTPSNFITMIDLIKSSIYIKKGQVELAQNLLNEIGKNIEDKKVEDNKNIDNLDTEYYYYLSLGELKSKTNDYKEALDYYKKCLALTEKSSSRKFIVLDKISSIYNKMGDYKYRSIYKETLLNEYKNDETIRNKENREYIIKDLEKEGVLIENSNRQLLFYKKLLVGIVIVVIIIMALIKKMRNLKQQTITDGLTNIYNRKYFDYCYNKAILKRENISILMIDIDDFKKINDTYGHDIGDAVIKNTAKVIDNLLDKNDLVFRYGGEEFCVLVKNKPINEVVDLAENIRGFIETIKVQENVGVTISLGIGMSYRGKNILKLADENLYIAKNVGKNKVIF